MLSQVAEQPLLLFLATVCPAVRAIMIGRKARQVTGGTVVNQAPSFLYCGKRDAQLVGEFFIGAPVQGGEQQSLLTRAEVEAWLLVDKDGPDPGSNARKCKFTSDSVEIWFGEGFVGIYIQRIHVASLRIEK